MELAVGMISAVRARLQIVPGLTTPNVKNAQCTARQAAATACVVREVEPTWPSNKVCSASSLIKHQVINLI